MDILNKIIDGISSRYNELWMDFDIKLEMTRLAEDPHRRIPLIPSIIDSEDRKDSSKIFLIAEIKQASPSQGLICEHFDVTHIAQKYLEIEVDAISVLTEEQYFRGSINDLSTVRALSQHLPLLRKDFIIHPYQVYEAYKFGADLVLLIVAALNDADLKKLYQCIVDLGMTPLIEVHNMEELERALSLKPSLIGINNRDLRSFDVNLQTSINLITHVPPHVKVISESGIFGREDVALLASHGFAGILVGQSILESASISTKIKELQLKT